MHVPPLQTASADDALATDDAEGARLLAADLRSAGYTTEGLEGAIRIGVTVTRFPGDLPFLLAALSDRTPLSTLVLLFRVGVPVPREDAERALPSAGIERLVAMRVLDADDVMVTATVSLDPRDDLVIASDWEPADREPDRVDHVIAPLAGTKLLRWLLPTDPVRRVLDLGAGTGYLALSCAAHAEQTVATDTNPRALRFARLQRAAQRPPGARRRPRRQHVRARRGRALRRRRLQPAVRHLARGRLHLPRRRRGLLPRPRAGHARPPRGGRPGPLPRLLDARARRGLARARARVDA